LNDGESAFDDKRRKDIVTVRTTYSTVAAVIGQCCLCGRYGLEEWRRNCFLGLKKCILNILPWWCVISSLLISWSWTLWDISTKLNDWWLVVIVVIGKSWRTSSGAGRLRASSLTPSIRYSRREIHPAESYNPTFYYFLGEIRAGL